MTHYNTINTIQLIYHSPPSLFGSIYSNKIDSYCSCGCRPFKTFSEGLLVKLIEQSKLVKSASSTAKNTEKENSVAKIS